ncbi:MAG: ABC transporter ATP-binding protein [Euryarchaeota archaeon]|nr:ABC transporter ATP-binding protein [Euryarchaeota archaeon]
MTGWEFLEHVCGLKGIDPTDADRKAEAVGIDDVLERKITEYSAGMRQRLGLVQALLGNPELVILDEPTSNLDPLGREEFLTLIKRFYEENNTNFLICTHILSELEKVCTSIIVINRGLILEYGEIAELMKKYGRSYYRVRSSDNENLRERTGGKIKERVPSGEWGECGGPDGRCTRWNYDLRAQRGKANT